MRLGPEVYISIKNKHRQRCCVFSLFSSCVYFGCCSQILCPTLSLSFCLTGKDVDEGGRFKSNTSPSRHGSVWSSIISLHPPCASLELGCFHGDHVFDGQVCVWWPVRCESSHPLLSSEQDAKDLACLCLYTFIHIDTYSTVMPSLYCRNETLTFTPSSSSTFRYKNAYIRFFFLQPVLHSHSTYRHKRLLVSDVYIWLMCYILHDHMRQHNKQTQSLQID